MTEPTTQPAASPATSIPTRQSKESLYAHTFTTAVIVVFSGIGMLTGKLHFGYFVGLSVLCGGWVTPAVAGAILMRVVESHARALYAMPPGFPGASSPAPADTSSNVPAAGSSAPQGGSNPLQRSATPDFPPPGLGGLAVVAAGAFPLFRSPNWFDGAGVGLGAIIGAAVLLLAVLNGC